MFKKTSPLSLINVLALILCIGHFLGGLVNILSIFLLAITSFLYFVLVDKLSIYTIFLFLIPSVLFELLSIYPDESNTLLTEFNNVLFFGPLTVSSKFFLALGVPFRILRYNFQSINEKLVVLFYFFILTLSLAALLYVYLNGEKNSSGLTIGFRSVLSLGVLFLPNVFNDRFVEDLNKILLFSLLLLATGYVNGHWMFIVYGFLPYIFAVIRPRIISLLVFWSSLDLLFNLGSTFTILLLSTFGILIFITLYLNPKLLFSKNIFATLVLTPIVFTIVVLVLRSDQPYDFDSVIGFARFKLFGDRKPIWDATWDFISQSNFLVSLPGSVLDVFFDFRNEVVHWPEGSHNIFLELSRNVSLFASIVFFQ